MTHGELLTVQMYANEFPPVNPVPQIQLKVCPAEQGI